MSEIWEPGLILLAETGSTSYGTNTVDSDTDLMGVSIMPKEYVLGLREWEQAQIKTAAKGERSLRGDTDLTIYSLQKFARITAAGNPNTMPLLFSSKWETMTALGAKLVNARGLFVSKEAGRRFLGYMRSQRDAMTGVRNKRTNRPELVEKYGYDSKFAYHLIRLGIQGIELMDTAKVSLPMRPSDVTALLNIRNADGYDRAAVLELSEDLESDLLKAIEESGLPENTDSDKIDRLLIELQEDFWDHGNWPV